MRQMYYGGKHTDVMWFYPTDSQDQLEQQEDEPLEDQTASPPPYKVKLPLVKPGLFQQFWEKTPGQNWEKND